MKTHASHSDSQTSGKSEATRQASAETILQAYKTGTTQLQTQEEPLQKKENKTGLPDNLKSGVENLSGHSLDDVKVHYNSAKPVALQAHAYAQGSDIHVAPGQEKHLPHEAWHVVQQKQGRVKPTKQLMGKTPVNDDAGLEKEADVMGAKAIQFKTATVQREETNEQLKEVSLNELPEDKARKHLSDSFKKGEITPPLVNESGQVVQRVPSVESWGGGELYTVLHTDLGKGTVTSDGTRTYVNEGSTPKPKTIKFDYASAKHTGTAKNVVVKNPLAWAAKNSKADRAYKSGRLWDAGHKLGRQNGGYGDRNDWVFPQNPALNQGNHRNMDDSPEETHPIWRAHEDSFHNGVEQDGGGVWWIQLT
ncbi:DUF4157 domain-containing protein [Fluviicola sp.]|uniref:eCIS core domain-containing protein n=1 Tax=Fluviicola sp. TaxID=1917219 RepID=UPI0031D927B1